MTWDMNIHRHDRNEAVEVGKNWKEHGWTLACDMARTGRSGASEDDESEDDSEVVCSPCLQFQVSNLEPVEQLAWANVSVWKQRNYYWASSASTSVMRTNWCSWVSVLRSCLLAMLAVSSVNAFEELRYLELMGLYFGLNVEFCWIYTIYIYLHPLIWRLLPLPGCGECAFPLAEGSSAPPGWGRTWQDLAGLTDLRAVQWAAAVGWKLMRAAIVEFSHVCWNTMKFGELAWIVMALLAALRTVWRTFRYISTRQHSTSNQVIVARCCKSQGSDFEEVREGPAVIANSGHRYEVMDRSETVKVKGIRPCCKSFTVGMLSVRWQVCLKCKSFVVGCSQHITRRSKGEYERATWNDLNEMQRSASLLLV